MYEEIVLTPLPFKTFGFHSAADFVMQKMPDVACVKT